MPVGAQCTVGPRQSEPPAKRQDQHRQHERPRQGGNASIQARCAADCSEHQTHGNERAKRQDRQHPQCSGRRGSGAEQTIETTERSTSRRSGPGFHRRALLTGLGRSKDRRLLLVFSLHHQRRRCRRGRPCIPHLCERRQRPDQNLCAK